VNPVFLDEFNCIFNFGLFSPSKETNTEQVIGLFKNFLYGEVRVEA